MLLEALLELQKIPGIDAQILGGQLVRAVGAANLNLGAADFKEKVRPEGVFRRELLAWPKAELGHIKEKHRFLIRPQQGGTGERNLPGEGVEHAAPGDAPPAPIGGKLPPPVGVGHHIAHGDEKQHADESAEGVGHQIVYVIKAEAKNELQVLRYEGNQKTGNNRTQPGTVAEKLKHIGQQVSHGDVEHDIHVYLGDVLKFYHIDMGEGRLNTLPEQGDKEIKKTVVRADGVLQIRKGRNVNQIFLRRLTGEKNQISKRHDVDKENREQDELPDLKQRVRLGVGANAMVQVYTEFRADTPVHQGKHKDHNQHQDGDNDIGGKTIGV